MNFTAASSTRRRSSPGRPEAGAPADTAPAAAPRTWGLSGSSSLTLRATRIPFEFPGRHRLGGDRAAKQALIRGGQGDALVHQYHIRHRISAARETKAR